MSLPPIGRPVSDAGNAARPAKPPRDDQTYGSGKPFDGLLADLANEQADAGTFLADARFGGDAASAAMQGAKVFNERGFFHSIAAGPIPSGGRAPPVGTAPGQEEAEPAPPARTEGGHAIGRGRMPEGTIPPIGSPAAEVPVTRDIVSAMTQPRGGGDLQFGPEIGRAAMPAAMRQGARPEGAQRFLPALPTHIVHQRAGAPAEEAAPASAGLQKRIAVLVAAHLRRANATDTRVEVRMVEEGLRIVAQTEKLDRAEQSRLLADIETLLARHGRGAAQISLNGAFTAVRRL